MQGLHVKHLTTGYRNKKDVIVDLSLNSIPKGKITSLLGPNGCGKSTLLRALAALNTSRGDIYYDDKNLSKLSFSQRTKRVVYLPQSLPAGVHLLVIESVLIALKLSSINSSEEKNKKTVFKILDNLGISHLAFSYLDELSGGQKQLVGLAQSLVRYPDILLLDEPLSALDINHQFQVMDLVKKITAKRNIVTIIVVHDLNIALRHSDYIIMIKKGSLIAEGEPFATINEKNLSEVYGIKGRIESCTKGYPFVIVDALS